ncbi:MAG: hypothetical protein HQL72_11880 [Magnetococcales bacterium]|nr:hypothetical protein [Magnetococcales bacterium]
MRKQHDASMWGFGMLGAMTALVALGGAVAVAINMMPGQQERQSVEITQKLLPKISDMLTDFAATYSRLPCPDLNDDGWEGGAGKACPSGQQVGTVPWRTLRLSDPVKDGMGVKVRYGVFRETGKVDLAVASNTFTPAFPGLEGAAAMFTFEPFAKLSSDLLTNSTLSTFGSFVDGIKNAIPGSDIVMPGNMAESFSLYGLLNKEAGLVDKIKDGSSAVNLYDFCFNLEEAAKTTTASVLAIKNAKEAEIAYKAAYDAKYTEASQSEENYSAGEIIQMAKKAGEIAANNVAGVHPAYVLVSGNRIDADGDGVDGAFDGENEGTDAQFDNPYRGRSELYDDALFAMPLSKLQVNLGCEGFKTAIDGMVGIANDMLGEAAGAQQADMWATVALVQGYNSVLEAGLGLLDVGVCAASQAETTAKCAPNFPAGTAGAVACGVATGVCVACSAVAITNVVAATLSQVTAYRNKAASSETVNGAISLLAEVMNSAWSMETNGALYPYAVPTITSYAGLVLPAIDQDAVDQAEAAANSDMTDLATQTAASQSTQNAELLTLLAFTRAQAVTDKQYLEDLETAITNALTTRGMTVAGLGSEVFPLAQITGTDSNGNTVVVTPAFDLSSTDLTTLSQTLDLDTEIMAALLLPSKADGGAVFSLRDRIILEMGDTALITGSSTQTSSYAYHSYSSPRGPYEGAGVPAGSDADANQRAYDSLKYILDYKIDKVDSQADDPAVQADVDAAKSGLADAEAATANVSLDGLSAADKAQIESNKQAFADAKAAEEANKELVRDDTRQLQKLVAFEDWVKGMNIKALLVEITAGMASQDSLIFDLDCAKSNIEGSTPADGCS